MWLGEFAGRGIVLPLGRRVVDGGFKKKKGKVRAFSTATAPLSRMCSA
jgi:hypothetical protein